MAAQTEIKVLTRITVDSGAHNERLALITFVPGSGRTEDKTKHEFHENHHSVTSYFIKKDSKRYCDSSTPESIHTKDESKRGSAFAFIFGVN